MPPLLRFVLRAPTRGLPPETLWRAALLLAAAVAFIVVRACGYDAAVPGRPPASITYGRRWVTAALALFVLTLSVPPLTRMLDYELPGEAELLEPFQPFGVAF